MASRSQAAGALSIGFGYEILNCKGEEWCQLKSSEEEGGTNSYSLSLSGLTLIITKTTF